MNCINTDDGIRESGCFPRKIDDAIQKNGNGKGNNEKVKKKDRLENGNRR